MNKSPSINDGKMPEDDNINNMNREYALSLQRQNILKASTFMNLSKKQNPHICVYNFDNIARCYFLEKDILLSLSFLIKKARMLTTKKTIESIICLKEKVASRLLSLYLAGTKKALNYSPNIIDRPSYNALYDEISYMQVTLLSRLNDIPCIYKIMCMEHSATLMLHSIKP